MSLLCAIAQQYAITHSWPGYCVISAILVEWSMLSLVVSGDLDSGWILCCHQLIKIWMTNHSGHDSIHVISKSLPIVYAAQYTFFTSFYNEVLLLYRIFQRPFLFFFQDIKSILNYWNMGYCAKACCQILKILIGWWYKLLQCILDQAKSFRAGLFWYTYTISAMLD